MSSHSIIGSGAIGSALAGHFASKGIEVLLANNRGPASLEDLVRKLGPKVRAVTVKDAAKADIVILAVPWAAYTEAVAGLAPWNNRIVIDASGRGRSTNRRSRSQGVQHLGSRSSRQRPPK